MKMKIFGIVLIYSLAFAVSCAYKPTNTDICGKDSADGSPVHEHCAFTVQGNSFDIGKDPATGVTTNYTQYGQNLTAEQFDAVALRISPWSYEAIKEDWLNYCHDNPKACTYSTEVIRFTDFEERIGVDRKIIPRWTEKMLRNKNEATQTN